MKIDFPILEPLFKDVKFEELMLVELNNTHIEKIASPLFQRMVDNGRASGATRNADLDSIVDSLTKEDPALDSFRGESKRKALLGWIMSSLLTMKTKSKHRSSIQMNYVRPTNVAVYRAGLPIEAGERRAADKSVYRSMVNAWMQNERHPHEDSAKNAIKAAARSAMGAGIQIDSPHELNPHYDGISELDIEQLLSLHFLKRFPPLATPSNRDVKLFQSIDDAIPGSVQPVGQDLYKILNAYSTLSAPEVIEMILAMTGFRLYQLPFRVQIALKQAIEFGAASDIESGFGSNPHRIFCDFTGSDSPSQKLAKAAVLKDIERMQDLFAQRILINVLERLIDIADQRSAFDSLSASNRLLERLNSRKTEGFQLSAGLLLGQIRNHVLETYESDSEEAVYLSTIAERIPDRVEQLVEVLRDAKIKNNMQSQMKWMWSIGGLQDGRERLPYSLLAGTVKHRQSWRYQPSDSLLSSMLAVSMVDVKVVSDVSGTAVKSLPRRSLPLSEVLNRMEFQFGVLINKVPDSFDTPENRVAAEENFRAFKNRLKQLGCFNGLSDDSLSQPVFNPKVSGNGR